MSGGRGGIGHAKPAIKIFQSWGWGVHCPTQITHNQNITLTKNLLKSKFSFLGGQGGINWSCQICHKKFPILGGGGGYIAQVKSTFGKIYLPKKKFNLGEGVHRPNQIDLWKNLPSKINFPILEGVHCPDLQNLTPFLK